MFTALAVLLFLQGVQVAPNKNSVDLPAIQEEYGGLVVTLCDQSCSDVPYKPDEWKGLKITPHKAKRWTCADKTRFLMTAEDGSKHCIALRNPSNTFTTN